MRILALTPYLSWPPEHGGRIRSFHLLAALAQGHELINVSGLAQGEREEHARELQSAGFVVRGSPLRPQFGRLSAAARARKLWDLCRGRPSLIERYASPELLRIWSEELERGADVIVLDHVWMSSYLPDPLPAPLVFSTHNVEGQVLARSAERIASAPARALARLEARRVTQVERGLARHSALCVATSSADAAALGQLAPEARVEVVANGVGVARCPLLAPPSFEPLRMLYVGGYDYPPNAEAGLRLAREILPRLRAARAGAELHLVGRDPLGVLAPVSGLPGVHVHGHVASLAEHYANASALVVPIELGGGSRLKILEAWAFGRPVVSSTVGAQGLSATPGEHYLQAEDPDQTVAALQALAREPELRTRLIAAGRARAVELHDWPALGRRFRALVEAAAAANAPS